MSREKPRVLVVEDDLSILTGVSLNLRYEGYEVLQAQDGERGLEMAVTDRPDLIVLDVMMPRLNGYEVLRELRSRGMKTPVLVLSAKGMERDKVLGLDLGADDYVVKPFGLQELLARIKAVLRRRFPERGGPPPLAFGDVEVDLAAKTVSRAVSSTACPPRVTVFAARSTSASPKVRGAGPPWWGKRRRSTALMRASSSCRPKGFTT